MPKPSLTRPASMRALWQAGVYPGAVLVQYNGKEVPLRAAAQAAGLTPATVYTRYHRGERDVGRLLRPARRHTKPPATFRLGLDLRQCELVVAFVDELAHEHGRQGAIKRAADKFQIPFAAVSAMCRGEWWRFP